MIVIDDSKCAESSIELINPFGIREITHVIRDIDGTHSLIRDWPPVMSLVMHWAMTCGLEEDSDSIIYIEKDGCQYDMKLHPPVPEAKNAIHHFVNSIINDTPHIATGEEGIIIMKILDAIYESAKTGEPVFLNKE